MPTVTFKGRGWDTESGRGDMTRGNSVVVLSEHSIIDPHGKTKKLTCSCQPHLASSHLCRRCKCGKGGKPCVAVSCGCLGRRGWAQTRITLGSASDPSDATPSPAPVVSEVAAAQEWDAIHEDESRDGQTGKGIGRCDAESERDELEDDSRSCAFFGSNHGSHSSMSDVEVGEIEDMFSEGL